MPSKAAPFSAPGSTSSRASHRSIPASSTAPRTTLLPHIGSATIGTRTRMAQLACQGVTDVLAGRTPPNLVT